MLLYKLTLNKCIIYVAIILWEYLKVEKQYFVDLNNEKNTYQTAILISNRDSSKEFCVGAPISTKHILTVAHCLEKAVRVNVYVLSSKAVFQETSYVWNIHPNYNRSTIQNDLAIIELKSELEFFFHIGRYDWIPNGIFLFAGFQTFYPDFKPIITETLLISKEECGESYGMLVRDSSICSVGFRDSIVGCRGNSGGLLIRDNKLVGVLSFGPSNCNLGFPVVYVSLQYFEDWVMSVILEKDIER